jgi:chitin disaccharide deacetylase
MSARHIIICADDYGISPAVSAGIRDLVARRRINATSAMVTSPHFDRDEAAVLRDAAASHAAIGLHVTLTAPFAPLSQDFEPQRHGAFLTLGTTLRRSHLRTLRPALLRDEVARQFEAFTSAFGRPPDFVDGHHHVHLFPQVRAAVLRVTKEMAPRAWVRQCGQLSSRRRLTDHKALLLDALSRRFRRLAAKHGLATNPAFAGTYSLRADAAYAALFATFLDGLPDGSVVMCHPGHVDAALKRLDHVIDAREREYAYFRGDAFPRLLAAHGVKL